MDNATKVFPDTLFRVPGTYGLCGFCLCGDCFLANPVLLRAPDSMDTLPWNQSSKWLFCWSKWIFFDFHRWMLFDIKQNPRTNHATSSLVDTENWAQSVSIASKVFGF